MVASNFYSLHQGDKIEGVRLVGNGRYVHKHNKFYTKNANRKLGVGRRIILKLALKKTV